MTNKDFDRVYKQHVTKYKGEDNDLSATFDNFLI